MVARHRKSVLLFAATSFFSLSALLLPPTAAHAQEEQTPQVENARHAFEGRVNANAVYLRSGPSENFYVALRLDKGAPVTVVGIKYNWLKIDPPAGSFSYVAKAYVQRHGDGSEGTVTANASPVVRAGSDLNSMKTTVQTKLQPGQRVKILGEQDEYFKIEPPAGAYLYVDQRYVDAVKRVGDVAGTSVAGAEAPVVAIATPDADASVIKTTTPDAPSTLPATNPLIVESVATSQPSESEAATVASKFEELEAKFKDASIKPLVDQPLEELGTGYQALATQKDLPQQTRRIVDARLAAVKVRAEARESYLVLKKNQQDIKTSQQALVAEREELQERIKQNDVKIFAAVGVLRTSSLQLGGSTIHRLTDPETGRTVVYIRGLDVALLPSLINQFIGVKGDLASDPQLNLKVVNMPTTAEIVDQTKVNGTVAAQVVPPSLLPKIPTAAAAGTQSPAIEPQ